MKNENIKKTTLLTNKLHESSERGQIQDIPFSELSEEDFDELHDFLDGEIGSRKHDVIDKIWYDPKDGSYYCDVYSPRYGTITDIDVTDIMIFIENGRNPCDR